MILIIAQQYLLKSKAAQDYRKLPSLPHFDEIGLTKNLAPFESYIAGLNFLQKQKD